MALPNVLPPQSMPLGTVDKTGKVIIDLNWYLLLYNIWSQVLPNGVMLDPTIAQMADIEAYGADVAALQQEVNSGFEPQADFVADPPGPSPLIFGEMQDPQPAAQPAVSVTVTASPFVYTALFDGAVFVSGGTVSDISVIRQGTTVPTGVTAGVIPVSRLDQVQITYTVAPTVNFL